MLETFETLSAQANDLEFVIFCNPTNASVVARAQAFCEDERLLSRNIKTKLVDSGATAADNAELMIEYAPKDSNVFVGVAGGDGTTSNILAAAQRPVIAIPYGKTNDIAKGACGGKYLKDPLALLFGDGKFQEARPLEIATADEPSSDTLEYLKKAFGYFSFGISAIKASELGDMNLRRRRDGRNALVRAWMDLGVIASGIPETPVLTIQDKDGERQVIEVLFANGHCMARLIRFGGVALRSEQAARLEVARPRRTSLAMGIGKAAIGHLDHFGPDIEQMVRVRTQDDQPFLSQADGDVDAIDSGKTLHIRRAATGPQMLMAA
jgi:hypothetical protein